MHPSGEEQSTLALTLLVLHQAIATTQDRGVIVLALAVLAIAVLKDRQAGT